MSPQQNQLHSNGTVSPRENGVNVNNSMLMKKMDHQDRDRIGGGGSSGSGLGGGGGGSGSGVGQSSGLNLGIGQHSPRSGTSSNASTPSNKKLDDKPSTPIAKSVTPTSSNQQNGSGGGGGGGPGGPGPGGIVKAVAKPPLNPGYPHYLGPMNGEFYNGLCLYFQNILFLQFKKIKKSFY